MKRIRRFVSFKFVKLSNELIINLKFWIPTKVWISSVITFGWVQQQTPKVMTDICNKRLLTKSTFLKV